MGMQSEAKEYELKLWVDKQDLRRVTGAPWFKRMATGPVRRRQLHAVYYDTPELALFHKRAAFRVRKEGRHFIQCLKTTLQDGDGALARGEFEGVVPDGVPDPSTLDLCQLGGAVSMEDLATIEPVFESRIRRSIRCLICPDGTKVEVDIDVGEITAGKTSSPVCELEIELREGDPGQLFRVAELVLDTVPARLGVGTKASRGYELLTDSVDQWTRAPTLSLSSADTGEDAFIRVILNALGHLRANENCVLTRAHAEGVHQMRVAVRRMRSALSIYRKLLPTAQFNLFSGELRWLLNELGPTRDMDVFLEEILEPVAAAIADDPFLDSLRLHAEERREMCYRTSQEAVQSKRYAKLVLRLSAWLHGREWRSPGMEEQAPALFGPVTGFAGRVLSRRLKRIRTRAKRPKRLSVEQLHELRIETKKLRYAAEFFRSLYPKKATTAYLDAVRVLQDGLGTLNDVSVARQLLRNFVGDSRSRAAMKLHFASGLIIGWHTHRVGQQNSSYADNIKQLLATAPFWKR